MGGSIYSEINIYHNIISRQQRAIFNQSTIDKTFKHPLYTRNGARDIIAYLYRKARYLIKKLKTSKSVDYKENGYHLFNIYAFAVIKDLGWNIELFGTKKFKKALDYSFSSELYDWLENRSFDTDVNEMPNVKNKKNNIYGYSYNAPGFELLYIYSFRK